MSKRRFFLTLPHNQCRNTTTNLLIHVHVEPQLQMLSGGTLSQKTVNNSDQDRVDVSTHELWLTGQVAFFDIRLFNPTTRQYINYEFWKSCKVNKKEKKKAIWWPYRAIRLWNFYFASHVCYWRHGLWESNVLCLSLRGDVRKKKRKLCLDSLLNKKKNKFYIDKFSLYMFTW